MNQEAVKIFKTYSVEMSNRLCYDSADRNALEAESILRDALEELSHSGVPPLNKTYTEWIRKFSSEFGEGSLEKDSTRISLKFHRTTFLLEDLDLEVVYCSDSPDVIRVSSYRSRFIRRQEYIEECSLVIRDIYTMDYEEFKDRTEGCIRYLFAWENKE